METINLKRFARHCRWNSFNVFFCSPKEKCSWCDKKAIFAIATNFFGFPFKTRPLCEPHKIQLMQEIDRTKEKEGINYG